MPRQVTQRAAEVLRELEAQRLRVRAPAEPTDQRSRRTATMDGDAHLDDGAGDEEAVAGVAVGDWAPAQPPAGPNGHALTVVKADPHPDLAAPVARAVQLALFVPSHPLLDELKAVDVMNMTPLEALNRLADLAKRAREA